MSKRIGQLAKVALRTALDALCTLTLSRLPTCTLKAPEELSGVGLHGLLSKQDCTVQEQQAAAAPSASVAATEKPLERLYERCDASGAPRPLAPSLVTLSMLPRPQWQTLVHLDAIQARSRPQQPPKKPEAAPFFLPTVVGSPGK